MKKNHCLTIVVILGIWSYGMIAASGQNLSATPNAVGVRITGTGVIKDTQVWIHSRATVYTAGNRIFKTGNERFSFTGDLVRGTTAGTPFQILGEISGKVRIENSESSSIHAFGTNGSVEWSDQGSTTTDDDDFIETFLNDTVEHFLELQASGAPMRFLGANFRFDDGTAPNYSGPFYDVYELADSVLQGGQTVSRAKVYCINSKTKLLERVQYTVRRKGSAVRVETILSGWQKFNGQLFPTSIIRMEESQQAWRVDVQTASTGPTAADAVFSHP